MEFLKNVIVWGFYKASIMPDFLKQTKNRAIIKLWLKFLPSKSDANRL